MRPGDLWFLSRGAPSGLPGVPVGCLLKINPITLDGASSEDDFLQTKEYNTILVPRKTSLDRAGIPLWHGGFKSAGGETVSMQISGKSLSLWLEMQVILSPQRGSMFYYGLLVCGLCRSCSSISSQDY
ncbi:MAG: hypothetical protein DYH02_12290 [Candidatus Omnitrophica bacterium COP1]|nr:hypothetical protein [Candidatus Omnitrophica bacterium COP1]